MTTKRRSLTPTPGTAIAKAPHAMRRGGARREVTERVTMTGPSGEVLEGWALNASRGGLRAILEEEKVELGKQYSIHLGDPDETPARRGRIVWLQEEPDGVIVGVEFTGQTLPGVERLSGAPPAPEGAQMAPASVRPPLRDVPPATPPADGSDAMPSTPVTARSQREPDSK